MLLPDFAAGLPLCLEDLQASLPPAPGSLAGTVFLPTAIWRHVFSLVPDPHVWKGYPKLQVGEFFWELKGSNSERDADNVAVCIYEGRSTVLTDLYFPPPGLGGTRAARDTYDTLRRGGASSSSAAETLKETFAPADKSPSRSSSPQLAGLSEKDTAAEKTTAF